MTADWRLQDALFGEPLRRADLPPELEAGRATQRLKVGVVRNEACEASLATATRMAAYARLAVDWSIGPYDDAVTAPDDLPDCDAILIWLDWRRLDPAAYELVDQRLAAIRASAPAPMLILAPDPAEVPRWAEWFRDWHASVPGTLVAEPRSLLRAGDLRDPRLARIAGSDLSAAASLVIARWIAITALPSIAYPPLKLIAVDLDNTLHAGILGEDGLHGVSVTDDHRRLGATLRDLRSRGVLLALVTKNDEADVMRLFEQREDLALHRGDFIAMRASWDGKAEVLQEIADELGISVDACALVDDNPGELAAVEGLGVWAIDARDARQAARVLQALPRVKDADAHASQREADLRARQQRTAMLEGAVGRVGHPDPVDLHAYLGTQISVQVDAEADLDRVADLLARTNQFNCTLARTSRSSLQAIAHDAHAHLATVRVTDRLADSGIVGALILRRDGDEGPWFVDEFVLSCRILGRGLEGALFAAMVTAATGTTSPQVRIAVVDGPRNEPAHRWLRERALCDPPWTADDLDLLTVLTQGTALTWQLGDASGALSEPST